MTKTIQNKKQLRWRCRRGMQEMDILLLRFLDQHYDQASPEIQAAFAQMLEQQDDVLWDWLSGQVLPDDRHFLQLVEQIRAD